MKKSMLNTKWWAVYRLGQTLAKLHGGTPLFTCQDRIAVNRVAGCPLRGLDSGEMHRLHHR